MNIDLTIVEAKKDGKTIFTAIAVVTMDPPPPTPRGQARKATPLPTVRFFLNGKAVGVLVVNPDGHAMFELGELKPGTYVVLAEILGAPAPNSDEKDFTIPAPPAKTKKLTGVFGWVMIVLFWLSVWYWGPGWLTFVYLVLTMGVLALIAKFSKTTFSSVAGNNNWVFLATLGMFIMSGVAAHYNPMVPESTLGWFGEFFSSLFGSDSPNSVEESALWAFFNRLFFGDIFTNGWSDSAWVFGLGLIPAAIVSYTDEVVKEIHDLVKKHGKGEGWLEFLKKDIPATIVIDSLIIAPLRAVMKGLFKFSLLVFMASTLVACSSPSEEEFKRLSAEKPATTTEDAEKAYDRVETLAKNVARLKKAPEGLTEKIDVLRKTRAEQFAKLAVKEKSVGSTVKVLTVLVKNGINPTTIIPTPTPGVTNNNPTGSGTEAIARKLSRPPVDPTADTIPLEWRK